MESKWSSYVFWKEGEVAQILQNVVCRPGEKVGLIIGEGFDPRMTECLRQLVNLSQTVEVFLLQIGDPDSTPQEPLSKLALANRSEVDRLIHGKGHVTPVDTRFEEEDRNSTAPSTSEKAVDFARNFDLSGFQSLIVDISALPQGVYFPLIEVLISQRSEDFQSNQTSLYVFVAENVELDGKIQALELQEDAYLVPPFRSALTGTDDLRPIVWFPILGEGEDKQIARVEKALPPRIEREVCPVLPMPSSEPRRGDKLLKDYEAIFQDNWSIDSRSFIYSDERNPFHLYTQLSQAALRYREALSIIGGCRAVISCHSSKLLSLGALLAASELNQLDSDDFDIGLANVDATRYSFDSQNLAVLASTYFLVPLLGEVYDA